MQKAPKLHRQLRSTSGIGQQQPEPRLEVPGRAVITMYAQLLSKSSTGIRMALTPFLSCSMTFS